MPHCIYCNTDIDGESVDCPLCGAKKHKDCCDEYADCGRYACANSHNEVPLEDLLEEALRDDPKPEQPSSGNAPYFTAIGAAIGIVAAPIIGPGAMWPIFALGGLSIGGMIGLAVYGRDDELKVMYDKDRKDIKRRQRKLDRHRCDYIL